MKYGYLLACLLWNPAHAGTAPDGFLRPVMAAYEQPQVEMYATSWCPYCQQARNYFRQQGIRYIEYDIEKDAAARQAYKAFRGRGIPIIFVGKHRMNGFSVAGLNKIYR